MKRRGVLLIALFILCSGCAKVSRLELSSFPKQDSEFRLCPEELKKQYADIEQYDRSSDRYVISASAEYPDMTVLFQVWGASEKQYPSWRNAGTVLEAGVLGVLFDLGVGGAAVIAVAGLAVNPSAVYVWQKGDYRIDCSAALPLAQGYTPFLRSWNWSYHGSGCARTDAAMTPDAAASAGN